MNMPRAIALPFLALALAGFASAASAQGLTRAEVRQQLIQAEESGSQFVTDTSYPDVNPIFAQQVAHQNQRTEGVGGTAGGISEAGAPHAVGHTGLTPDCVGPVSFCTLYFGS